MTITKASYIIHQLAFSYLCVFNPCLIYLPCFASCTSFPHPTIHGRSSLLHILFGRRNNEGQNTQHSKLFFCMTMRASLFSFPKSLLPSIWSLIHIPTHTIIPLPICYVLYASPRSSCSLHAIHYPLHFVADLLLQSLSFHDPVCVDRTSPLRFNHQKCCLSLRSSF